MEGYTLKGTREGQPSQHVNMMMLANENDAVEVDSDAPLLESVVAVPAGLARWALAGSRGIL